MTEKSERSGGSPVSSSLTIPMNAYRCLTAWEVAEAVVSGKVEYCRKDELLCWSVMNAAVTQNSFGEIKIDKRLVAGKKKETKRIDPVDAVIDAYALMLVLEADAPPVNIDDELGSYLDLMGWR